MARKKHTLEEVLKSLKKKRDCKVVDYTIWVLSNEVYNEKKMMDVPNPAKVNDLGNGSWGKIDYLRKVHGYVVLKIDSLKKINY